MCKKTGGSASLMASIPDKWRVASSLQNNSAADYTGLKAVVLLDLHQ